MADSRSILDSIINQEIQAVASGKTYTIHYEIKAVIHTPKQDVPALFVESVDTLKDYVHHFSDVVNVSLVIPSEYYNALIYPNREKLEMTLTWNPLLNQEGFEKNVANPSTKIRYLAKLTEHSSKLVEGNHDQLSTPVTTNGGTMMTIQFQLIDPVIDALRYKTVGMIARNCIPMDFVRYCLTKFSKDLGQGIDSKIVGCNVVEGYSTEPREHLIVPHLTKLVSLPQYVNEHVGGIYPTGFSYYLRNQHWYIYPLWDMNLYAKSQRTLTIINVPSKVMPNANKTFRLTNQQVIILSTGEVRHLDTSETEKSNRGSAVRFIDSRKVVEGFGQTGGNKFVTDYGGNVVETALPPTDEYENSQRQALPDKLEVAMSYNLKYSELAERQGSKIMVTWENSQDDILYPGMPVRFIYKINDLPRQLYGTLLAVESMTRPDNQHPAEKRFRTITVLSCFVGKDPLNTAQQ